MSDDTPATDAQAAEDATPTPQDTAPAATPATEPEAVDPEALRKLRSENKSQRDRAKAAETEAADLRSKVEAFEAEKLSETERLQKQAEDAQDAANKAAARAKTANLRAAVAVAVVEHGIDADAAQKLIADEVSYDENDEPENVGDLVAALVEKGVLASKNTVPSSGLPANAEKGGETQRTHEQQLAEVHSTRYGGDPLANPENFGGGVFFPE